MTTIVTRAGKGSALTHTELDNNFTNLNTDKVEASGDSMTGNLSFGDNNKAVFGAGSDLQIYHDGSNSYIVDSGIGNMVLQTNGNAVVIEDSNGDNLATFNQYNGTCVLSYITGGVSSAKLATTSTGVDVTGTVTADGLTVDGQIQTNIATTGRSTLAVLSNTAALAVNNQATIQLKNGGQSAFISGESVQANAGMDIVLSSNNGVGTETVKARFAENGDISFYEDTGTTAKFFWDASAESLGIGTTSPAAKLHSVTNGAEGLRISNTTSASFVSSKFVNDSAEGLQITNYGSTYSVGSVLSVGAGGVALNNTNDLAINVSTGKTIRFGIGNTEAARIDSSGNLLVGRTSASSYSTTVGATIYPSGLLSTITNSGVSITANRTGTDGPIQTFHKDGTTVGSIGTNGGRIYLANSSTGGVGISSAGHTIAHDSAGGVPDATNDLGISSVRWRNLYLSGGVYLGGTGAANLLDDYEEGTFTPTVAGDATGTLITAQGYYTKIGRMVNVAIYLVVGTNFTSSSIGGLPFTVAAGNTGTSIDTPAFVLTNTSDSIMGTPVTATTTVKFYNDGSASSDHLPNTTNTGYRFTLSYIV